MSDEGIRPDRVSNQELWFLTAHPDTLELSRDAPDWLAKECEAEGLVMPSAEPGIWKLTIAGYEAWRDLLARQAQGAARA